MNDGPNKDVYTTHKPLANIGMSPEDSSRVWESLQEKMNQAQPRHRRGAKRRFHLQSISVAAAAALLVVGGGWYSYFHSSVAPAAGGKSTGVKAVQVSHSVRLVPTHVSAFNMLTNQHGWAAESEGNLEETTDGGATWSLRYSNSKQSFKTNSLESVDEGWVLAVNGILLHSTDSGKTWAIVDNAPNGILRTDFVSPTEGYVIAQSDTDHTQNTVYRTTDGGKSWNNIHLDGAVEMAMTDMSQGFVLTHDKVEGYKLLHVDGITNSKWSAGNVPLDKTIPPLKDYVRRIYLVAQGPQSVWLGGTWNEAATGKTYFGVFHTDDLGQTWTGVQGDDPSKGGTGSMLLAFHGSNGNAAYGVVQNDSSTETLEVHTFGPGDAGVTQKSPIEIPNGSVLRDFYLTDTTHGIAAATNPGTGESKFIEQTK